MTGSWLKWKTLNRYKITMKINLIKIFSYDPNLKKKNIKPIPHNKMESTLCQSGIKCVHFFVYSRFRIPVGRILVWEICQFTCPNVGGFFQSLGFPPSLLTELKTALIYCTHLCFRFVLLSFTYFTIICFVQKLIESKNQIMLNMLVYLKIWKFNYSKMFDYIIPQK